MATPLGKRDPTSRSTHTPPQPNITVAGKKNKTCLQYSSCGVKPLKGAAVHFSPKWQHYFFGHSIYYKRLSEVDSNHNLWEHVNTHSWVLSCWSWTSSMHESSDQEATVHICIKKLPLGQHEYHGDSSSLFFVCFFSPVLEVVAHIVHHSLGFIFCL